MFILGYFLMAVGQVLNYVLVIYLVLVIARAVLSWVSPDPYNPIVRFIHNVTEPVMFRIRTALPVTFGGIDFSPIIVLLVIMFLRTFLVKSIMRLAQTFI